MNIGQLDEVIDPLTFMLKVETGVLECIGKFDNRLADVLDLFLGGDLRASLASEARCGVFNNIYQP